MFKIMDTKLKKAWWCFTPKAVGRRVNEICGKESYRAELWAQKAKPGDTMCVGTCEIKYIEVFG